MTGIDSQILAAIAVVGVKWTNANKEGYFGKCYCSGFLNVLFWYLLTDGGAGPQCEAHGTRSVRDVKRSVKLTLPVFGLASYKFRGSIWTSNGVHERQLSSSLLQAADNWLRLLRVDHPDYSFFVSHYSAFRR
ncbi:hypothetical protein B296_00001877 [Ensete ventricosum]|uniref:Uncharacterized protein n=1 Tax=Ensete ventricosum TaxID=4639 RepID=A0A427A5J2_ENSVE|nr:hypothetical protein B296_00001877 [Ensete ventricosum]